jgi:type I restriction enzyme S subunit
MEKGKQTYKLPEGWCFATIEEIIDYNTGVFKDGDWVESKDQDPKGEVRLIQLADIGDGEFLNRSNRYMSSMKADKLGCTYLCKGDLLIARMPEPLGRACIFPF